MQGQLAESQGQGDKALESYKKALAAEPNNAGALVSMARYYDRKGDSKQAIEYFQKAASTIPTTLPCTTTWGWPIPKQAILPQPATVLNKAISLNGKEVRYRNNLATLLVENGQADEAVKQLQQVLPPAVAHYNVAYLHFTKQNIPAAQQQLQVALQIDPNLAEARALYSQLGCGQAIAGAQARIKPPATFTNRCNPLETPLVCQPHPQVHLCRHKLRRSNQLGSRLQRRWLASLTSTR